MKLFNRFFCSRAILEHSPCLNLAMRECFSPSAVLGPVESPPCKRHLPFCIAGDRQEVPALVLAPHRGAFEKSPEGLPFFKRPRFMGSIGCFSFIPPFSPPPRFGRQRLLSLVHRLARSHARRSPFALWSCPGASAMPPPASRRFS